MRSAGTIFPLAAVLILFSANSAAAQGSWDHNSKLCAEYSSDAALASCEAALSSAPDDVPDEELARVYLYMGIALGELGRTGEAIQALKKAQRLDKENPKIYYNLGVAQDEKGDYESALHNYRKATELDLQMSRAWGNRGVDAYLTKRWEEAAFSFDNALTIDPAYFDTRPDQRNMWTESIDVNPKTVALRRETSIRLSPMIAYLVPAGDDLKVKKLVYLMFDAEADVQIQGNWYATGSFTYAHTKWESASQGGGMNTYAPSFGVKYAVYFGDVEPVANTIIANRSRYFFSLAAGPYITSVSAAAIPAGGYFSTSRTAVDIGVNAGAGFDYYFHPNVGWGVQMKMHYVAFDENYFIIAGGPHLAFRF